MKRKRPRSSSNRRHSPEVPVLPTQTPPESDAVEAPLHVGDTPPPDDYTGQIIRMMDLHHEMSTRDFLAELPLFVANIQEAHSATRQYLLFFHDAAAYYERGFLVGCLEYQLWAFLAQLSALKTCIQSYTEIRLNLIDVSAFIEPFDHAKVQTVADVTRWLIPTTVAYHTCLLEYGKRQSQFMQQLAKYLQISLAQDHVQRMQDKATQTEAVFFSLQQAVLKLTFVLFKMPEDAE